MSTSINVHPSTATNQDREGNRLTVTVEAHEWPRTLKLTYRQGGPGVGGDHETCIFIGTLCPQAIRDLASSLEHASTELFEYANVLDEYGNDKMEG